MEPMRHLGLMPKLLAIGLPEDAASDIYSRALPSIRFIPDAESKVTPKFSSKIGGSPDLSPLTVLPDLPFIMQVNVNDLIGADFGPYGLQQGMLHFFFDLAGYNESQVDSWEVIFINTLSTIPGEKDREFTDGKICETKIELTLPSFDFGFDEQGLDSLLKYEILRKELAGIELDNPFHTPLHRFLGNPDTVQGDIFIACEEIYSHRFTNTLSQDDKWLLLLQVDTDDNMEWEDTGRIYFCIRRSDLLKLDFSKVILVVQSS